MAAPANARPASSFELTPEEIAMLPDPEWVTADDADAIVSMRLERAEVPIPLEEVLRELGCRVDR